MRKTIVLLLLFFIIPVSVSALTAGTSYTDSVGYTHYNFNDGTTGTSRMDDTGQVNFFLNDGTFGSASLDSVGTVHYYFDNRFTTKQNTVVSGKCYINYNNFVCLEESQYQTTYNNALQGLPSCNPTATEHGSFSVPAEYCTPEGREKLIMSGSYGSQLKMCRDSLNLYAKIKTLYDKCVQDETDKFLAYEKQKIDYLAAQARANQKLQNDLNCIKAGAIGYDESLLQCKCVSGKYYDSASKKCISECPQNSTKTNQGCMCNSGYSNSSNNNYCELIVAKDKESVTINDNPIPKNVPVNKEVKSIKLEKLDTSVSLEEIQAVVTTGASANPFFKPQGKPIQLEQSISRENNFFRNFTKSIVDFFGKLKFW